MPPNPELLCIDPTANLNVAVLGEGDDRRFHVVAMEWWARMPESAKNVMVPFWTEDGCRRCQFNWGPLAGLLENWPGRHPSSPASFRNNRQNEKFYIAFCPYYFDKMPNDIVVVLMAHEFAHLYQLATGTLYTHQPLSREEAIRHYERDYNETYEQAKTYLKPETLEGAIVELAHKYDPAELEVDSLVSDWRFDLGLLHRWDEEVGSKIEPPVLR